MKFFAAYDLQTDSNDLENSPVSWCIRKELEGGDSVPIIEVYPDPFDVQDQESPEHDQEYKDAEKVAKVCANMLNARFGGDAPWFRMLHDALDHLMADFISETKALPSESRVIDLLEWSYKRMKEAEDGGR